MHANKFIKWLCVWIGYFIAACFICLTGRIGATYHISFPVMSRASFGIWGSLWPVFNRAAMACIWYGVQAWIGGTCVVLMIRAIWPSFYNLNDTIAGSGTNSRDFVGFLIFWVGSLPAIWYVGSICFINTSAPAGFYARPDSFAGSQSTLFATSSPRKLSSCPSLALHSFAGLLLEPMASVPSCINQQHLPAQH